VARRNFGVSESHTLTFYRGDSDSLTVECHPADVNNDVLVRLERNGCEERYFLRREQARRFARILLEAAGE
jgi:hypothetical protein